MYAAETRGWTSTWPLVCEEDTNGVTYFKLLLMFGTGNANKAICGLT